MGTEFRRMKTEKWGPAVQVVEDGLVVRAFSYNGGRSAYRHRLDGDAERHANGCPALGRRHCFYMPENITGLDKCGSEEEIYAALETRARESAGVPVQAS